MTFTVEIMLRGNPRVFSETLEQPGDPGTWTGEDMQQVVAGILRQVDHALQPPGAGGPAVRPVNLRGLNWIVHPAEQGVVLAFEIHSASVVAGPFHVAVPVLERLMVAAVGPVRPGTTVH
jgi:hypothetical protein